MFLRKQDLEYQARWLRHPALAISLLLCLSNANAHHSYAMFDGTRRLQSEATVARLEWQNPHVFLWFYVPTADGKEQTLVGLESDSTNVLRRMGWTAESLKPGQRITVEWFPLRDGRQGGHLISVSTAEGQRLQGGPAVNALEIQSRMQANQPGTRP